MTPAAGILCSSRSSLVRRRLIATSVRFGWWVFNAAVSFSLECIDTRSQAAGFDGLTGEFSQVTNGPGLRYGAGLRLGPKRFDLLLE